MSAAGELTQRTHTHAELLRSSGRLADELVAFFGTHHRTAGDAAAVRDALYAVVLRDAAGTVVGAITVNLPADLTSAALGWAGVPRTAHLISHLAVHPYYRRAGHGTALVRTACATPTTRAQELVIAVSYAADHSDHFWAALGFTMTRRATPAVLPAAAVGLIAPDGVDGISAGNLIDPARFVYRDLTDPSVLTKAGAANGLPVSLEMTATEQRLSARAEGTR